MMRGVKFACEPCIRGHRSSKCNHSDRVLVQVRKPGRPLSSCPHTLSSTSPGTFVHSLPNGEDSGENKAGSSIRVSCSCDVTSVAIPKIASCACGTPKPQEPPPKIPPPSSLAIRSAAGDSGAPITSPISPTFPPIVSPSAVTNGSSNKIVKPQRPKKNSQARKGSINIGEAALGQLLEQERERSSSAESLKAENTASNGGITGISSANRSTEGNGLQNFGLPTTPTHGDISGFRPSQGLAHPQNGNTFFERIKVSVASDQIEGKPDMPAGVHSSLAADAWDPDGKSSWQLSQPTSKKAGCGSCGGKLAQPPQPQPQPQQYIHHISTQNPQETSPCNGSNKGVAIQAQQMVIPQVSCTGHPFFPAPQYPASYIPPTNFSQIPNMWMFPTINPAITPQEFAWLQQQRAAGVFGPQPTSQLPGHVAVVSPINNSPVSNTSLTSGWEHNCHCGPECNCLGCATHPFNRRTVEHVREMQSFMAFDNHGSLSPQPHPNPTNSNRLNGLAQQLSQPQPQQGGFETNGILSSSVSSAPSPSGICCGNKSSPGKQISPAPEEEETGPDGTPNGTDAGDGLSPSNFLYFDFPLGMCAQTGSGCKCGEGCTCVGCITHGGHIELDTPAQAPEWEGWGTEEGS